jgi:hypothetical protein
MRKYFVVLVLFGLTVIGFGGMSSVALALPAGHVPVYLIPYTRSETNGSEANAVTVITITRVGGTAACDVSVDWINNAGTTVSATTQSVLDPPSATSQNVGDSDNHCSHDSVSGDIVNCIGAGLAAEEGKAVVGAKSPCGAGNLAVDARVIYLNVTTGAPSAIHSLKVLKPFNKGNKGD